MAMQSRTRNRFFARIGGARVTDKRRKATYGARRGMQGIIKEYQKFVDTVEAATPQILYEALLPAFELSKEYCPKDTGAMVASGYLEITTFRGRPTVQIGYGRGGTPSYTARVHENMEWKHEYPTRAKWLQVALAESRERIQNGIIAGLKI